MAVEVKLRRRDYTKISVPPRHVSNHIATYLDRLEDSCVFQISVLTPLNEAINLIAAFR